MTCMMSCGGWHQATRGDWASTRWLHHWSEWIIACCQHGHWVRGERVVILIMMTVMMTMVWAVALVVVAWLVWVDIVVLCWWWQQWYDDDGVGDGDGHTPAKYIGGLGKGPPLNGEYSLWWKGWCWWCPWWLFRPGTASRGGNFRLGEQNTQFEDDEKDDDDVREPVKNVLAEFVR